MTRSSFACFCLVLAATGSARASGFSVARFSGEQGHPTTDNATALYFNPAALRAQRPELLLDGTVAYRRATYTRAAQPTDAPDIAGAEGANVGRATLSNWLASPSLWFMLPVSPRLVLAAGVFTPFGGPIKWDTREAMESSPYPGPLDGVSRYHAIEGLFSVSYGSLGVSYALSTTWRLGASFNTMYTRIDDVRAWSAGSNGVAGEGRSLVEVDGFSFGFGAGVFYECACRGVRAGISYQSRPNVAGGMSLSGRLSNNIGGPSSANVELHQDMPDVLRAGVAVNPHKNVELRLSGSWERWSAFERQCVTQAGRECELAADGSQPDGGAVLQNVQREFRDGFDARAGVSMWTSDALELFSGLAVMSKAVPDATLETSLPDFMGVTFSLGAKARLNGTFSVAGSLSHVVSPARDVGSKYATFEPPSRMPSASGHYTHSVSYANLNVTTRF